MERIKELINGPEYDFLRETQDLQHTIYLTISGSYAYGTNKEGSDIDLRGVVVEQPRYIYGLDSFEQLEERETDTVIFGLKKYILLCVNANPNALELLGTSEDCIVHMTPAGKLLRDNSGFFLSRRAIHSFGNYASAQLRRLSNALCHDSYSPARQQEHLANTLNNQIEHFNRTYARLGKDGMRFYLSDETEPQLLFDMQLRGYPARDFSGIYSEIHSIVRTYGKLNYRNRKKDEVHLNKHAMHLIRLLITGKDILSGNGICTNREDEQDLLMDIRNGKYTKDEVFDMAQEYQHSFEQAAQFTDLPEQPDLDRVEALMMGIYQMSDIMHIKRNSP